jgi:SAM-dependent methyltransferase
MHSFKSQFLDRLRAALADGSLVRLNLGGAQGTDPSLRNVFIRPVSLRGSVHLSFTYRHAQRDVTKNHPPEAGLELIESLLGMEFTDGFLSTTGGTAHLNLKKGRSPRLEFGKPEVTEAPDLSHDQPKRRTLRTQDNPWLRDLGVTGEGDRVNAGMEAKYRQIHRFVELLGPLLDDARLPTDRPVVAVDMGCGKGYLTFALYEHLRQRGGSPARVQGIEVRGELCDQANQIAVNAGFDGLQFVAGAIDSTVLPKADVVVALHACDTATDDALAKGIAAGASLLVMAPCCHKEIRPQLVPPPVLAAALSHGILRQREAEFVTDALRAALLEAAGYESRVFEFIAPEHTSKNLMIAGVRRANPGDPAAAQQRAIALARFYGIREQRLARQLGISLKPPTPAAGPDPAPVAHDL